MGEKKSNEFLANKIGGKNIMPIASYYGPHPVRQNADESIFPDYFTDEYFAMIAECGVNVITYSHTSYDREPELVQKSLDLGQKYGIGIFVLDDALTDKAIRGEITKEEVEEHIAPYRYHPAFCGMFVIDEPRTPYYLPNRGEKELHKYGRLANILQHELGVPCFLNMFPVWKPFDDEEHKANYERYVADFCDTLQPNIIMWDKYPFYTSDKLDVYFYIMDYMRQYAEKYQVPFWPAIGAGAQFNDDKLRFDSELPYYPTEGQFAWNVNNCLAFGVKGLDYFPLIQPVHFAYAQSKEWDCERNGLIGMTGNRTQWFYYAKRINRHISVIDEVLMSSVHKGIIVNGEQAQEDTAYVTCTIPSQSYKELVSVTGDTMIGCFEYKEKTAFYVVNYNMEESEKINLHFDNSYEIRIVQDAIISHENTQNLQLDMVAGEGVLIVLES